MKLTREPAGGVAVRAVGAGRIRIGDTDWDRPVALTEAAVLGEWAPTPITELATEHFHAVIATEPEVIVLGTGSRGRFVPRELVFAFARRSIGFEAMDTAAAARTFNVLAGEGRKVAAVLYPPTGGDEG